MYAQSIVDQPLNQFTFRSHLPPTLCAQLCGTPNSHLLTNIAAVRSMSGPEAVYGTRASHRTIDSVDKESTTAAVCLYFYQTHVMSCFALLLSLFFSFFLTVSVPQICSSSILNVSCIKFDQPFPPSAPVSYIIPMSLSFGTSYRQLSTPATVLCRWS